MKNKQIYIVLTYSGTILSRIIKFYTKKPYSHVSIALDQNLDKMYSFGRLNPYNPFIGGFVHEGINFGTFKRFKNTKAKIYALDIDEEQYKIISKKIDIIKKDKHKYTFNIIGLLAITINFKYRKKNSYYCAEFVKYLFDSANLDVSLPELVKPSDFQKIDNLELAYTGILKEYNVGSSKFEGPR